MLWVGLVGCGYKVGSPAPALGLRPGTVEAPVAEAGLPEAMTSALTAAIRRHQAQGSDMVSVRVHHAELRPLSSRDGAVYAYQAELAASFQLLGASPRQLELQRSTTVSLPQGGSQGLVALRAAAFAGLAVVLADEAVDLLLHAPPPPSAPVVP